jgi:hypothetical protein
MVGAPDREVVEGDYERPVRSEFWGVRIYRNEPILPSGDGGYPRTELTEHEAVVLA